MQYCSKRATDGGPENGAIMGVLALLQIVNTTNPLTQAEHRHEIIGPIQPHSRGQTVSRSCPLGFKPVAPDIIVVMSPSHNHLPIADTISNNLNISNQ